MNINWALRNRHKERRWWKGKEIGRDIIWRKLLPLCDFTCSQSGEPLKMTSQQLHTPDNNGPYFTLSFYSTGYEGPSCLALSLPYVLVNHDLDYTALRLKEIF